VGGDTLILAAAAAAGFLLIESNNLTAFEVRRRDGQRLIFLSTAAAFLLIVLSRLILFAFHWTCPSAYAWMRSSWHAMMLPGASPWLGTTAVCFLVGVTLPTLINCRWDDDEANVRAIKRHGSQLEQLMLTAVQRKLLIAITTRSRKVYVARVVKLPPMMTARPTDISLLPFRSGYRDEKSLRYVFTTTYVEIYRHIAKAPHRHKPPAEDKIFETLTLDDFEIVVPIAEIITAHLFDEELYSAHRDLFRLAGAHSTQDTV